MKLTIKNFAKIKSAELQLDGMTVICGDNNTGKSTVGKVLTTVFESLVDLEKKIINARKDKYETILAEGFSMVPLSRRSALTANGLKKILDSSLSDADLYKEDLYKFLENALPKKRDSHYIKSIVDSIMEVRSIPDSDLKRQLVTNCFAKYFNSQWTPLNNKKAEKTEITLNFQKQNIALAFPKDKEALLSVTPTDKIAIRNHAFFIDTPDILDRVSDAWQFVIPKDNDLNEIITKILYAEVWENSSKVNPIDDYLANNKVKQIYEEINASIKGDFVKDDFSLSFHEDGMSGNVEISNLSKGMKAFALLLLLLKKHILRDDDILVLDEPEIHLHPAWQVLYAEILVLLQKAFNLNVLLTTHSSYFLEAIQLSCRKYHFENILHIYQSVVQSDNGMVILKDDGPKANDIYASFMEPLRTLQDLRNELKEQE
ncbi:MAG: AAA family ATPase [Lentisphaeria bacterium]|nr:AAA family ATPase [Lentisphaeria bacterium]